jgi:hypothetical protein
MFIKIVNNIKIKQLWQKCYNNYPLLFTGYTGEFSGWKDFDRLRQAVTIHAQGEEF